LQQKNIDLDPKYQRRDAWNDVKKSKFVESLFLRLPVPQIVLAEISAGSFAVIDGKQRLLSIARFALDGFGDNPLRLKNLEYRKNLNNKTYSEIEADRNLQNETKAFVNNTIRTVVVRNWGDEDLLYLLFLRLNQNSVTLSPQELRGVLHPGPFVDFMDDWSGRSDGMKLIFHRIPDFRMRDVELAIRYFAFKYFSEDYAGNMKKFLDDATKSLNKDWLKRERDIKQSAGEFDKAIRATNTIFDGNPFREDDLGARASGYAETDKMVL
jgi:hypothetical protein